MYPLFAIFLVAMHLTYK